MQVKKDFQEVVLGARQDDFFKKHMYANFGDLGMAVKGLVDEFQKAHKTTSKVSTIEDMQNFVENFSEFSAAQRNAGKHVTLMSELSRLVDSRNLMTVSAVVNDLESMETAACIRWNCRYAVLRRHTNAWQLTECTSVF